MRIALLPSAYAPAVGGVEVLTQHLAHHLLASGHRVEVWTIRHPSQLPAVDTIQGITVRRFALPLPAAEVGKALLFGPAAARAAVNTARAARSFSPQVLHVQCFSANGVYASALSALSGVPLVLTLQGETVMDDNDIYERSTSLRLGLRAGLRRAHTVTACSQFVLDDAVRGFGLPPGAGVVVPNGVDDRDPTTPTPLELPFERFVLGLGRVVEKKGIVVLEALQAGRPVIVSAHGGASEIVRDGKEGLVVDPFDCPALATAIRRILDDSALRTRLTDAGRARVRDFTWEAITESYVAIYERSMETRRNQRRGLKV
jgi:glycogen(starch) synthase